MKDGSAKVSLAEAVQKLPVGQSLITVTDAGKAVMQVSLKIVCVVIMLSSHPGEIASNLGWTILEPDKRGSRSKLHPVPGL